jgi:hypothetical protein
VPGGCGRELKVEDERRLKLVSHCFGVQLLSKARPCDELHTYGASCQAGCHCRVRGDGIELHDDSEEVEDLIPGFG